MSVDPAVGKILGMVMAYVVSFLGLLLAYYNHRKRAGKAPSLELPHAIERVPETPAKVVEEVDAGGALLRPGPWLVMGLVATLLVLTAAAYSGDYPSAGAAILAQLPGIIVPGAVFAASFWVTWALYRKFAGGNR